MKLCLIMSIVIIIQNCQIYLVIAICREKGQLNFNTARFVRVIWNMEERDDRLAQIRREISFFLLDRLKISLRILAKVQIISLYSGRVGNILLY